jgi:hypothetical protein
MRVSLTTKSACIAAPSPCGSRSCISGTSVVSTIVIRNWLVENDVIVAFHPLETFWSRITKPMAVRDETRYPPQGGPYGGPLK